MMACTCTMYANSSFCTSAAAGTSVRVLDILGTVIAAVSILIVRISLLVRKV